MYGGERRLRLPPTQRAQSSGQGVLEVGPADRRHRRGLLRLHRHHPILSTLVASLLLIMPLASLYSNLECFAFSAFTTVHPGRTAITRPAYLFTKTSHLEYSWPTLHPRWLGHTDYRLSDRF